MIRAILFDFDGTLARYHGDFGAWAAELYARLELPGERRHEILSALASAVLEPASCDLPGAWRRALAELDVPEPADLEARCAEAVAAYAAEVRPRVYAAELLAELDARGMPLALVSNGPEDMQRAALDATGLTRFFRAVLISGDPDVGVRKPHPRIFGLALTALERVPAEALMVGDNEQADIQGALDYGLQAVHLGGDGRAGAPCCEDLSELRAWLLERLEPASS